MDRTSLPVLSLKEITQETFYIARIDVMDNMLSNISTANANTNFT